MVPAPRRLRVEHLEEALGIDVVAPRLSWQLAAPATRQEAYRLEVGTWSSGWVESDECVLVPYDGPAVGSRTRLEWRVQVRTDAGVSAWSAWSWWETGLLRTDDWTARWISPVEVDPLPPAGERPASVLRTRFTVTEPRSSARIHATAHGLYELFLDGDRVGDQELTPGYTSYRSRVQVQTYDVTTLLGAGEHELRAVLSDGWYRGKVGFTREHDSYGSRLALLAQVEVDGVVVAATDAAWTSAPGAIVEADLIDGESVDQRVHDDPLEWQPVEVIDGDFGALCASPAPPVRRVELLRPREVRELAPGRHVVDLGQNVNGWIRIADPGPVGTELTLTYGEALDADGDITQDHIGSMDFVTQTPLPLGQIDRVVSDGSGTPFEPRHTTHGFQFVRIEGHPGPLTSDDVTGVVVHTDLRRTGWFACSDARSEPAAPRRRLELPHECVRHPDRLPSTRARRVDRRLAALLADGGLPLRRGRVLHQVAARPRRRPAQGRRRPQLRAGSRAARCGERDQDLPRGVVGVGRRVGARAVGDVAGLRRPAAARGAVAVDGGVGRLRDRGRA